MEDWQVILADSMHGECPNGAAQRVRGRAEAQNFGVRLGIKLGALMGMKLAIWTLLIVPGLLILFRYLSDAISYGQVIHQTGLCSAGLLIIVLSISPLRQVLAAKRLIFLSRYRRALGVASFGYAALHTGVYLERKWGAGLIVPEGLEPWLATGWLALLLFLVLAATSNDASVRALRTGWKKLHRTAYIGAALTFAHWLLATFNPIAAFVSLVLLIGIQLLRLGTNRPSA